MEKKKNSVRPLILIGPKTGIQGGGTVSFNHLLNELDERKVKYICVDMPGGNYTLLRTLLIFKYVFLFCKIIKKDSVISLHASENSAIVYTIILHIFCRFTNSKLMIRVFGGQHLDYLLECNKLLRWLVVRCYRNHMLLMQTKGMLQRAKNEFQIYNAVWFPTSRPSTSPKSREKFNLTGTLQLLYLGQIRPEKGIKDLIYLARKIQLNELSIQLQLYGQVMDRELLKMIEEQNEDIITYKGLSAPGDVYQLLRDSDLLLMPSRYKKREGYPGALIEALNVHVPFIATGHHLYIRELVTEG
ncbi:MAG: glycosyltransferase family 4 protein, partial [Balneolaceae bacterium]